MKKRFTNNEKKQIQIPNLETLQSHFIKMKEIYDSEYLKIKNFPNDDETAETDTNIFSYIVLLFLFKWQYIYKVSDAALQRLLVFINVTIQLIGIIFNIQGAVYKSPRFSLYKNAV